MFFILLTFYGEQKIQKIVCSIDIRGILTTPS